MAAICLPPSFEIHSPRSDEESDVSYGSLLKAVFREKDLWSTLIQRTPTPEMFQKAEHALTGIESMVTNGGVSPIAAQVSKELQSFRAAIDHQQKAYKDRVVQRIRQTRGNLARDPNHQHLMECDKILAMPPTANRCIQLNKLINKLRSCDSLIQTVRINRQIERCQAYIFQCYENLIDESELFLDIPSSVEGAAHLQIHKKSIQKILELLTPEGQAEARQHIKRIDQQLAHHQFDGLAQEVNQILPHNPTPERSDRLEELFHKINSLLPLLPSKVDEAIQLVDRINIFNNRSNYNEISAQLNQILAEKPTQENLQELNELEKDLEQLKATIPEAAQQIEKINLYREKAKGQS